MLSAVSAEGSQLAPLVFDYYGIAPDRGLPGVAGQ